MSEEDDDWTPSPMDDAALDKFYALAERHPTFLIVMKIVHGRTRLKSLLEMDAPEILIQNERDLLERRLDELCAAMPYHPEVKTYPLPGIIEHFREELERAPGSGDDA